MKQVIDQVTGETITINLISAGKSATLTICANGVLLTETVRGDALSMARVAFAKRDLDSFGSFFDLPAEAREAA